MALANSFIVEYNKEERQTEEETKEHSTKDLD